MCNGPIHRPLHGLVDPFSTFHFLRTYNRLVAPSELAQYYNLAVMTDSKNVPFTTKTLSNAQQSSTSIGNENNTKNNEINSLHLQNHNQAKIQAEIDIQLQSANAHRTFFNQSPNKTVSSTCPATPPLLTNSSNGSIQQPLSEHYFSDETSSLFSRSNNGIVPSNLDSYQCLLNRRQRGEKRPIPDEQKDEKYFERRKRNNEAAKKSRDARKIREDRIAFRAAILEQENSILRAQVIALREEVNTLRQIMCNRANSNLPISA